MKWTAVCCVCLCSAFLAGEVRAQAGSKPESNPSPSAAQPAKSAQPAGVAVRLQGRDLFLVQERMLSFSAQERAQAISARIERLVMDPGSDRIPITVVDGEVSSDVICGDLVVMSVTDRDAQAGGQTRSALAQSYARLIGEAVRTEKTRHSLRHVALSAAYALLCTLFLLAAVWLTGLLLRRLQARMTSWRGTVIRSVRIQKLELLSEDRLYTLLMGLGRMLRAAAIILLFYFYLPLVLSFLPWTEGYAAQIFQYVLTPIHWIVAALAGFLPDLFFIAVIFVATHYVMKLTGFFFAEVGKGTLVIPGFFPDWAAPTCKIARFLICAFAAVVVFPYLPGSKSPAFQGVSVFLGLLLSLGSSSAVANIVAGILLTYTRAFQIGDRVKIDETVGDVVEKTLLVTRVRTIKNVDIAIPNSLVLGSHVVNYSATAGVRGLILHTTVTIGYDAPWRDVHRLLIDAALATESILQEPQPFVFQTSLNDFHVSYEINAFTNEPSRMAATYSLLHQNIQDRFNAAGVEIMSPSYASLRDGNRAAIPDGHLPSDYTPPAFRVSADDVFSASSGSRPRRPE
jgi:small-conductance mechanosensitive channel